jgi:threonine synthase
MNNNLMGFRCLSCGKIYAPDEVTYTCPKDGGALDSVFDYDKIARDIDPRVIAEDEDRSIWHYAPLLATRPISSTQTPISTLGWTPLYRASVIEKELDIRAIWLKDDTRLPSSSFKDRASAMAIVRSMELKKKTICVASSGNAAAALACLCAGTDLRAVIFVPESTPEGKLAGILIHGAKVFLVRGSYNDAVAMAHSACEKFGWYNRSTGINAWTREGKKTAGFEIAEQLALADKRMNETRRMSFRSPDAVIVPTGDGNIISGVHKGFNELNKMGWIDKVPRFIAATATLAPSFFRAWKAGTESFELASSKTIASGISVDVPCDGVAAIRAVRETNGTVIECSDEEMLEAMSELGAKIGVFAEPACAAAHVALVKARKQGIIRSNDEVVLQLTGSGFKDIKSALRATQKPIVIDSLDEVTL